MPDLAPVIADDAEMRLDRYLRRKYPKLSLGAINRALRQRMVRLNNKRTKRDVRIAAGDIIYVPNFFHESEKTPEKTQAPQHIDQKLQSHLLDMLISVHKDFFVLNKPQGLAVQGGGSVRWHLDRMLPTLALMHGDASDSLRIVHRLDKETSGLLLIARGRKAAAELAKQFRQRCVGKWYLALCHGVPDPEMGRISVPLGKCPDHRYRPTGIDAKMAETDYYILDETPSVGALLLLSPLTGRTHQLRAHLAHLGHSIMCDALYSASEYSLSKESQLGYPSHGLALHACALDLPRYATDFFLPSPPENFQRLSKFCGFDLPSAKQLQNRIREISR